jgi:alpha-methylacyl-CoA racemase
MSELVAVPAEQARVRAEIAALLAARTRDEWETVFAGVDACVEPVLTPEEVLAHPQHQARQMFFDLDGLQQTRTPLGRPDGHTVPPSLGQHSRIILGEAGLTTEQIDALYAAKITR